MPREGDRRDNGPSKNSLTRQTWGPSIAQKKVRKMAFGKFTRFEFSRSAPNLNNKLQSNKQLCRLERLSDSDDRLLNSYHKRPSCSSSRQSNSLKRSDQTRSMGALYSIAAILASVGAGYDIRISNLSAIHPSVPGAVECDVQDGIKDSNRRRDAYFSAIRDSFIEPETSFDDAFLKSASSNAINHDEEMSNDQSITKIRHVDSTERLLPASEESSMTPSSEDNYRMVGALSGFSSSMDECNSTSPLSVSNDSNDTLGIRSRLQNSNRSSNRKQHAVTFEDDCSTNEPIKTVCAPVRPISLHFKNIQAKKLEDSLCEHFDSSIDISSNGGVTTGIDPTARSFTSPGLTPPHITLPPKLMDIDVDSISTESSSPPFVLRSIIL